LTVARAADPTVTELTARSVLGALGLSGGAAKERRIGDLSGGEKARVALAAFVLRPVNVLLLDEASNHLDTAAIDALTGALRGWQGAVVAVTHNETFADALEPTFVARVENGSMKTRMVTGGTLSKKDFSPNAVATGGVAGAVAKPRKPAESGGKGNQPQMSQEEIAAAEAAAKEAKAAREKVLREARNAPKTIDKIERALAVLDDDIAAIDARLMECGADVAAAQEIQVEKDAKTEKAALYYAEWERLEEVMMQAEEIAEEA
jgi:ABC-type multidrug transport system ATPase subunit